MIPQTLPPQVHFAAAHRPRRGPRFGALAWTPERGEQLKEAIKNGEVMFWDVDTQKGFMWPIFVKRIGEATKRIGLTVPGADAITATLKKLTQWAQKYNIPVIATMDTHDKNDPEFALFTAFSDRHCHPGDEDYDKIPETVPAGENKQRFITVSPREKDVPTAAELREMFAQGIQVVVKKNTINFMERRVGKTLDNKQPNKKAIQLLDNLKQLGIRIAVVYGVATDYCVQGAVASLKKMGFQPIVVEDAIKEISGGTQALHDPANPVYADVPVIQSDELAAILKAAREGDKPQAWQLAGFPDKTEHDNYLLWKTDEGLDEIGDPIGTPRFGFPVPPGMKLYEVLVEKHPDKPWTAHQNPFAR